MRAPAAAEPVGAPESNKLLSLRRAESVRDALVRRGVAAGRLTAVGLGEENPVATNDTDAGRAQNRRIEFSIR